MLFEHWTDLGISLDSGGCAAGFMAGMKQRSIPAAFGACAVRSAVALFRQALTILFVSTDSRHGDRDI